MSYRSETGRIYRMPTHFGPAPGPRQLPGDVVADPKRSPRRLSVAASFLTDPAVLEQHLPEGFTLAGEPVVTVEFHHMTDIDWLAGAWLHDDLGRLAGDVHGSSGPEPPASFWPSSGRIPPIRSSPGVARSGIPNCMPKSRSHAGGTGPRFCTAGWMDLLSRARGFAVA